ncbi:MAG TPA: arginine--tRNA ligase [Bacteroidia bacterium]|nr:arginine--tRNA ligase [Bacteroidia bacterium]
MNIEHTLSAKTAEAIASLYGETIASEKIIFQKTSKEHEADYTLVVFPFLKMSRKSPEQTASDIGNFLQKEILEIEKQSVIKGFLNITLTNDYWLKTIFSSSDILKIPSTGKKIMVEYSSPNTNKPLHLGHVRNNLLGYAVSEILKAAGNEVIKVNLVNDRGIHICKSMLAWQKWGGGETPESRGIKGDHLVGKYYVEFDKHFKLENAKLQKNGLSEEEATKKNVLQIEIQEMLLKWEAGDKETINLWKTMNGWVYKGFEETYKNLGVDFDKIYYESETYLLGKNIIEKGLADGVLQKNTDGSVFIDLTNEGLDKKILLRADGTSVYMTQDIGTAALRADESHFDKMIYTVGNEQDYHFKVLFLTLKKLGYKWADECFHLSYGMVELPEGKMKSREGTVVDADDLIKEMIENAKITSTELGKIEEFSNEDAENLFRQIGMGALKYFILKVDPKKKMLFDPKESIDFNGHTGPFIQYTYARIQSLLRKAKEISYQKIDVSKVKIERKEKELIKSLLQYAIIIKEAAEKLSPAEVANYVYELAKEFNQFYHEFPILKEESEEMKNFRLLLSEKIGKTIFASMNLLGIELPEKM